MESVVDCNGGGSRLVMTELSNIKELVKKLDVHLGGCPDLCKHLAAQIVTVTERSMGMIMSGHFHGPTLSAANAGIGSPAFPATPSTLGVVSKKRKMMEKGDRRVRVRSAGGGADNSVDDGFSWRKYGQKEILGAQHPRGYCRCTYRKTQGCAATKQVQRADEDPTLYDVTYHGTHTCLQYTAAAANTNAGSLLQNLSSSLTVNTEGQTAGPQQSTPFGFSSPSVSGLTPPPEHYTFSSPSTPSLLVLSPLTSDSCYIPLNPFEECRAQRELETLVSAFVTAASMQQPEIEMEMEDAALTLDGLELLDLDFDPSIFFV